MKCWVCSRQAKGFGHVDLRFKVGHPKRYPINWIFCSLRCQACFHRLYAAGVRAIELEGTLPTGVGVIDATDAELAAAIARGGPVDDALDTARASLEAAGFAIDYVTLVDAETLDDPLPDRPRRLLAAARLGNTRLIDNIAVNIDS